MGHILVVEDDTVLNEFLTKILRMEGYKVSVAFDGKEALEKMRQDKPDVIILDLMLPKINGFDVYKEIISDNNLKDITVIVNSALDRSYLHKNHRDLLSGVKAYFTKPFDLKKLLFEVKDAVDNGGQKVIVV